MIAKPLQQWTDRMGVPHRLRLVHELAAHERGLLNVLRQQTRLGALVLEAGYHAPAIRQAAPNMIRMILRILLPNVDDDEIAAFDNIEGNNLLIHWWAVTDATLLSA